MRIACAESALSWYTQCWCPRDVGRGGALVVYAVNLLSVVSSSVLSVQVGRRGYMCAPRAEPGRSLWPRETGETGSYIQTYRSTGLSP